MARTVVAAAVVINVTSFVLALLYESHLASVDEVGLATPVEIWVFFSMVASTTVVGASLVLSRAGHPMGWLFLALGMSVSLSAPIDSYSYQGAIIAPGSLPVASFVAVVGSLTFVPWLVIIAVVLHTTPSGRPLSRRFAFMMHLTIVAGLVSVVAGLGGDRTLDPPFDNVSNPLAVGPLAGPLQVLAAVAVAFVGLGLVIAALSLVFRFRRAQGTERLQLFWFAIIALPVAALTVAAFVPGHSDAAYSPLVPTGAIVVLITFATGLAVKRHRLYDVERILSRTLTYGLLSAIVVAVFVGITVLLGAVLGRQGDASQFSVAIATLCAIAAAEPARRRLQDRLDRRFDRHRYSALAVVRSHLNAPEPVADIEAVLREALGDESLEISYPTEVADGAACVWVRATGRTPTLPATTDVLRGDRLIARVAYDHHHAGAEFANEVFRAAATEMDNAGLRALLAVQLEEVRQSRARLAAGQHDERRRIEQNLHDGAQQRLLALALQFQAATLDGTLDRLNDAVQLGVREIRESVLELRALANGLRPSALTDGGLAGALDDLADRDGLSVTIAQNLGDLRPDLEETAWFIVCEAVANAQKHGHAHTIGIATEVNDDELTVTVSDDGSGNADPQGHGLRGLRDRAEAVGGSLIVGPSSSGGTTIRASLPCG